MRRCGDSERHAPPNLQVGYLLGNIRPISASTTGTRHVFRSHLFTGVLLDRRSGVELVEQPGGDGSGEAGQDGPEHGVDNGLWGAPMSVVAGHGVLRGFAWTGWW